MQIYTELSLSFDPNRSSSVSSRWYWLYLTLTTYEYYVIWTGGNSEKSSIFSLYLNLIWHFWQSEDAGGTEYITNLKNWLFFQVYLLA